MVDAVGGVLAAGEDAQHLGQLQAYAAQTGKAVELHLAVLVDDHEAAAHFTACGHQGFLQGIPLGRLKKRRKGRGQLFNRKAVLTDALLIKVIADQVGERRGHDRKRTAYNQKKGQQDLPPDTGPRQELSPCP